MLASKCKEKLAHTYQFNKMNQINGFAADVEKDTNQVTAIG